MVSTRITTAAELFAMGDAAPFELFQGELIEVSPSAIRSNYVLGYIHTELSVFVRAKRLGYLSIAEGGYLVESNPDTVIAPDIAFVSRDRIIHPVPERGYLQMIPDLIVEVISPTDERRDIERKRAHYDRIQVPIVWWIDPRRETATIQVPGQPARNVDRTGTLFGEPILQGFTLDLSDVFAEP